MLYQNEFDATMQYIQGKWKIQLLYKLAKKDILRFNQLQKAIEGISHKTLTNQLRELEEVGLISRTVFAEVPPRVEYTLTPKGQSIIPVLDAICDWGLQHVPAEELAESFCT